MLPLDVQAAARRRRAAARRRAGARAAAAGRGRRRRAGRPAGAGRAAGDHRRAAAPCSPAPAPALRALGELIGAVLATSAVANGLFAGDPLRARHLGRLRLAARRRLLGEADVDAWRRRRAQPVDDRHGALIAPDARVVQVDLDARRSARTGRSTLGVLGDAAATAEALLAALARRAAPAPARRRPRSRARSPPARWRDEPYEDARRPSGSTRARSRSRSTTMLPPSAPSSSTPAHFMGWPSMYLRVPDAAGFVFPQAFQCVGLGLGNAIGAAIARPGPADRRRARRRRRADGAARARDGRPARAADCWSWSTTTRPTAPRSTTSGRWARPVDLARFPAPTSPRSPRPPAAAASPCARPRISPAVREWLADRDRPAGARREGRPRRSARNGSRRHSDTDR